MRITRCRIAVFAIIVFFINAYAQEKETLFHENFESIDNWRPFYFSKFKKHTKYTAVREGQKTYLKSESDASASAIIYKKEFDVYQYPRMRWKWRIENVYRKGNVTERSGDDYPMRVYVLFKYDPGGASFGQKIKYGLARKIYGEYPPHSSLNYIWANRKEEKGIVTNPYADEAKMVILEAGPDRAGQWAEEDINIVDDYRRAFGSDPPAIASIALMNDSDNTGESSVSYFEYIEVSSR
jgi:hypothetical protein